MAWKIFCIQCTKWENIHTLEPQVECRIIDMKRNCMIFIFTLSILSIIKWAIIRIINQIEWIDTKYKFKMRFIVTNKRWHLNQSQLISKFRRIWNEFKPKNQCKNIVEMMWHRCRLILELPLTIYSVLSRVIRRRFSLCCYYAFQVIASIAIHVWKFVKTKDNLTSHEKQCH